MLLSLNDFTAAQAGCAHADPLARALHFSVDWAQIDVPAPLGHIVGVAYVVSRLRLLAADFANLGHDYSESNQNFTTEIQFYWIFGVLTISKTVLMDGIKA